MAAERKAPLQLKLPKDIEPMVHQYLLNAWREAVGGVSQRDADLAYYDETLEMRGAQAYGMRVFWRHASELEDPLVREQHTQLHSKLSPPLQRDLLVTVDAQDPADAESAKRVEAWLSFKNAEEGFAGEFDAFISNGLRDPTAIIACQWQQEYRQERWIGYWDGESTDEQGQPVILHEEEKEPGKTYQEIPQVDEDVESQRAIYETIELADFYLYPAQRQSLKTTQGILVRKMLSECQLLDGIEEYGYDADAVMKLIKLGPTITASGIPGATIRSVDPGALVAEPADQYDTFPRQTGVDNRTRMDTDEGIDGAIRNHEDGLYECFEYLGYLPKLRDEEGKARLPEYLFRDRVRAMFCPMHRVTFMLDFAPVQGIPYFSSSLLKKKGRFLGMGLVQLLEAGGLAATYLTRWTLDSLQMEMTPAWIMSEEDYAENGSFDLYPGAKFTESTPNSMRPLVSTQKSVMGFEGISHVLNRFKSLAAAEGIGELQPKVRKNQEVQNVLQTADSKYGLYGYNLYSILPEIAAWRVALELQFNPDFEEIINTPNGQVQVSAADLRKRFRFNAIQISADSNPETRAARNRLKLGIQAAYIQGVQQFPQWALEIWHGARQALLDLDERDPISLIGDEAKAQEMAQMAIAQAQQQAMMAQQELQFQQVRQQAQGMVGHPPALPGMAG